MLEHKWPRGRSEWFYKHKGLASKPTAQNGTFTIIINMYFSFPHSTTNHLYLSVFRSGMNV